MNNLFRQSPARRADFSAVYPESKFPKKSCHTRWIVNVDVRNHPIEAYSNVKEYLAKAKKASDKKTIETLKTAIQDPLTVLLWCP